MREERSGNDFRAGARRLIIAMTIIATGAGCPPPPGKPAEEARWTPPSQVTDFRRLYAQNCAGCHGADGRLGAARPLNDPLYLAFAGADEIAPGDGKRRSGHGHARLRPTGRRQSH